MPQCGRNRTTGNRPNMKAVSARSLREPIVGYSRCYNETILLSRRGLQPPAELLNPQMSNRDDGGASSPGHAETLFATPEWFAIWSAAFGQDNYNVWRPAGAARDLAIPYCRQHVKIT